MDRLQKKCFIGSAGFHLLLGGILLVGPAFLSSSSKSDNTQILDVIPAKVIDAAMNGGGNPNAKPPPALPLVKQPAPAPQPQPQPQPEVKPAPEPQHETVRDIKPERLDKTDPDSLETATDKKKLPKISLTPVVRPTGKKPPKQNSSTEAQEQRLAYVRQQRAAALIGSAFQTLTDERSNGITIETPGTDGGEAYASYDQVVRSIYWHAWVAPDDTANDDAIVKATVTIASDGNVLSARILRASGDSGVDRSIQRTLERVTFVHAFPEGAKEKQRTYTINFNLKAKRLSG